MAFKAHYRSLALTLFLEILLKKIAGTVANPPEIWSAKKDTKIRGKRGTNEKSEKTLLSQTFCKSALFPREAAFTSHRVSVCVFACVCMFTHWFNCLQHIHCWLWPKLRKKHFCHLFEHFCRKVVLQHRCLDKKRVFIITKAN